MSCLFCRDVPMANGQAALQHLPNSLVQARQKIAAPWDYHTATHGIVVEDANDSVIKYYMMFMQDNF